MDENTYETLMELLDCLSDATSAIACVESAISSAADATYAHYHALSFISLAIDIRLDEMKGYIRRCREAKAEVRA